MTHLLDAILALVALEAVLLRRHPSILPNLLAGAALLLATRLALSEAALPWVGLCLAISGIAHATDLRARLKNPLPLGENRVKALE